MPEYEKKTIRHIMGRVGRDPEVNEEYGFTNFSVAVTRSYDADEEDRWYGVSVNRDELQASVLANIHKGSVVGVEGVPTTSKGNDGRIFHNFKAFRIALLDYLALEQGQGRQSNEEPDTDWDDEDDL